MDDALIAFAVFTAGVQRTEDRVADVSDGVEHGVPLFGRCLYFACFPSAIAFTHNKSMAVIEGS